MGWPAGTPHHASVRHSLMPPAVTTTTPCADPPGAAPLRGLTALRCREAGIGGVDAEFRQLLRRELRPDPDAPVTFSPDFFKLNPVGRSGRRAHNCLLPQRPPKEASSVAATPTSFMVTRASGTSMSQTSPATFQVNDTVPPS